VKFKQQITFYSKCCLGHSKNVYDDDDDVVVLFIGTKHSAAAKTGMMGQDRQLRPKPYSGPMARTSTRAKQLNAETLLSDSTTHCPLSYHHFFWSFCKSSFSSNCKTMTLMRLLRQPWPHNDRTHISSFRCCIIKILTYIIAYLLLLLLLTSITNVGQGLTFWFLQSCLHDVKRPTKDGCLVITNTNVQSYITSCSYLSRKTRLIRMSEWQNDWSSLKNDAEALRQL